MQRDLRIKEIEIAQEIIEIDKQKAVAGMALQKITEGRLLDDPQDSAEEIEQLQDQRAALDDSRKLLEELLAEARHVRTGQTITNVDMSDGGRLLVGLINCDEDNGKVRQEIHNVKATNHGKGGCGNGQRL
ncbi:uncharacterized protein N7477_009000 [Penicillium maclennaniae]|uniref:uncharacterized protein n=1 Tax=Penicillium maclennaniae TaxID=1343394 RepID=UPI00254258DD|nr:uncharacterized protein N7477_009000 [Penicillium maclennaniae]KAJ5666552.1 hypothetical protein N7477_009000 [Penicillium maclennaniae]